MKENADNFIAIRESVIKEMDLSHAMTDDNVLEVVDLKIVEYAKEKRLSLVQRQELRTEVFNSLRRLDVLQELVDDDSVTEIMVNGMEAIYIERDGRIDKWDKAFLSRQKLEDVIQQIVSKANRAVNEASPIVDARLENGARVNVVLAPVAINGPIITIRRFPNNPIGMKELVEWGSISNEAVQFLERLVKSGYNIFISGGTGSGKTTFLNALSEFIPSDERIITIEDSAELQIRGISNLVRMETRNANVEGCNPISIRDLIKSALRMRPNRIIVGEVRGSEAIDMMSALNTGHDGSMSTGHANSCKDMLSRLETMILMGLNIPLAAVRRQIASGIDIIVHLGRLRDKSRKVLEICEVKGFEEGEIVLRTLYEFEETAEKSERVEGKLTKKRELFHKDKLIGAGIDD